MMSLSLLAGRIVYNINCLKLQYYIDRYLPVSMEKIQCGIVWLFCIFETSVLSICGVNRFFYHEFEPLYSFVEIISLFYWFWWEYLVSTWYG